MAIIRTLDSNPVHSRNMMSVGWNDDPRDSRSISYSERKIIDNLEKPLNWLTGQVNDPEDKQSAVLGWASY